jgi:transcriptional regulator with XRE-family HTH domain
MSITQESPTSITADVDYRQPVVEQTRSLSLRYADARSGIAELRKGVDDLDAEAQSGHNDVRRAELDSRTNTKAKASVPELLAELGMGRGMGWSDIASVIGVSVSAIRKWRTGGAASPENRRALAQIAALLDMLEQTGLVHDPAGWMEMRLALGSGFFVRPIDLYHEGHDVALLDLATMPNTDGGSELLDKIKPSWREERSAFEVYTDSEGERLLRKRSE